MKISGRIVSDEEKWKKERERFNQMNLSQKHRTIQFKIIEKVRHTPQLWHPYHKKDCRSLNSYVKIRKSINQELGTNYSSEYNH